MRKISVTEALVELKLYDAKIEKAIAEANLISTKKKSSDVVGHLSVEEYEKRAKAAWQSVTDYIKNRNKLKSEIVLSNATTLVTIDDVTMTVAEAIEKRPRLHMK